MKAMMLGLCLLAMSAQWTVAQETVDPAVADSTSEKQELINLSKQKWLWMSERGVDALDALFHEKAVFVHMGGNMTKEHELNVIRSGRIHSSFEARSSTQGELNQEAVLQWTAPTGTQFEIESSSDLGSWQPVSARVEEISPSLYEVRILLGRGQGSYRFHAVDLH